MEVEPTDKGMSSLGVGSGPAQRRGRGAAMAHWRGGRGVDQRWRWAEHGLTPWVPLAGGAAAPAEVRA
jgi:hypothetical protein